MFISADDFRVKTENFDLTKSSNVLRIICGAFFIPHALGKFAGLGFNPPIVKFFTAAGFHPPELWISLAAAGEFATAIALVLGVCTRFAALSSAFLLLIAVYALQVVKGFGWTWNTGGYEYPVFWLIASLCVALDAWQKYLAARQPARRMAAALAS